MRIAHNIIALNINHSLKKNNKALGTSLEKLSSGLHINKASDDAAGLAISEGMRAQIRGLEQAERNIQDGISLIQTAEGALGEIHDITHRMKELSVQGANGTLSNLDKEAIQSELDQLKDEIGRISTSTQYNSKVLLDGSFEFTTDNKVARGFEWKVDIGGTGTGSLSHHILT
ncbi:flagellin N-terminal helical domain-containing protein [Bacillus sp. SG-1]|uniref:flagellin n=1 Tax=Bacillus sp. SG-1 TaxID=161544 RepID=UPI0002D5CB7D